jgi:capsular polysaccharide export protein
MSLLTDRAYHAVQTRRDFRGGDVVSADARGAGMLPGSMTGLARRDAAHRHFLLVSSPFGPFSRRLGKRLREAGAGCTRVLLNAGDLYDWGPRYAAPYLGGPAGFRAWLVGLIGRSGVTDVIIYGDTNPYCIDAAAAAHDLDIPVHVLEQGYFRPFWITLERDGVNGNSSLPRDPEVYLREAKTAPPPEEVWLPPLTPPAAWKISFYHLAVLFGFPLFPLFRQPYQYSFVPQGLSHARRYIDQRLFRRRHLRNLAEALRPEGPLFLGVLQRPGDSQITLHSDFSSTAAFIEAVVASFARHAPRDARLLFKSHPLDHGLEPHGRAAARAARAHGVDGRVFFTDIGDLSKLLPSATGVVTVNSTAGLAAIEVGVPTITLGKAIYDMPGLTHQDGLRTFWTQPEVPRPDLYLAYRKVVIDRTQISGAFATRRGVDMASPQVVARLLAAGGAQAPGAPGQPAAWPRVAETES